VAPQVKPFSRGICAIVTGALPPEAVSEAPVGSAAELFASCTVEDVFNVDVDTVRVTAATTPLGIAVLFQPQRMQVWAPVPLSQVVDLPAPVAPELGATVADEKSVVE
jgi:hypothetical protein